MTRTIAYLKGLFITGYKPKQADYADLFDSMNVATEITWLAFLNLYGMDMMIPGLYKITDSTAADAGIFVRALDNSRIKVAATGLFMNCDFQNAGGNMLGIWWSGITAVMGNYCIWNGMHWKSLTGVLGSYPDGDATNWKLVDRPDASYIIEADAVDYDVVMDVINRRKDKRGNDIGSSSGFQWGNDNTTFNYSNGVGDWRIQNQRGRFIGNFGTGSALISAGETCEGDVLDNKFMGSGIIDCSMVAGRMMEGCTVNYNSDITFNGHFDYSNNLVQIKYSDIPNSYVVSGMSYVQMTPADCHIGELLLTSTNSTETINNIKNLPEGRCVRVYLQAGLSVTFATGGVIKMQNGSSFTINGTHGDWIEFEKRGGKILHTNTGKY